MAGGTSDKGNKIKIGFAAGALVIAGVLIAWNFGAFDFLSKPPPPPVLPPDQLQEHEAQKAKIQKQIEKKEIPPPSGA